MASNSNSPAGHESPSIIGSGISVEGDIEADVDLRIRGKVLGNVRCAALVLGEQGEIRGDVVADRVRLSGLVEGAIVTGDLALEESARVKGDVTYSRVRMVKGAVVQGRMSHVACEDAAEAEPVPASDSSPVSKPAAAASVRKSVFFD